MTSRKKREQGNLYQRRFKGQRRLLGNGVVKVELAPFPARGGKNGKIDVRDARMLTYAVSARFLPLSFAR